MRRGDRAYPPPPSGPLADFSVPTPMAQSGAVHSPSQGGFDLVRLWELARASCVPSALSPHTPTFTRRRHEGGSFIGTHVRPTPS